MWEQSLATRATNRDEIDPTGCAMVRASAASFARDARRDRVTLESVGLELAGAKPPFRAPKDPRGDVPGAACRTASDASVAGPRRELPRDRRRVVGRGGKRVVRRDPRRRETDRRDHGRERG